MNGLCDATGRRVCREPGQQIPRLGPALWCTPGTKRPAVLPFQNAKGPPGCPTCGKAPAASEPALIRSLPNLHPQLPEGSDSRRQPGNGEATTELPWAVPCPAWPCTQPRFHASAACQSTATWSQRFTGTCVVAKHCRGLHRSAKSPTGLAISVRVSKCSPFSTL